MLGLLRPSISRARRQGLRDATYLFDELERRIDGATRARMAAMAKTAATLPADWQAALEQHSTCLLHICAARAALRRARTAFAPSSLEDSYHRYCISELFLRTCFEFLTSDPMRRERMHLVTGPITPEGVRVPSHMQLVELEEQSAAFVAADPLATAKQLSAWEREAHALLCVFHSHIMRGADSTQPSQTDITTQDRFAAIGWEAIGGIFSLDGYVRFFSTAHDFVIDLYGAGGEIISTSPRQTIVKLSLEP